MESQRDGWQPWLNTVSANVVSGVVLYALGAAVGLFPATREGRAVLFTVSGLALLLLVLYGTMFALTMERDLSWRTSSALFFVGYSGALMCAFGLFAVAALGQ
jgi:hypothetical protein